MSRPRVRSALDDAVALLRAAGVPSPRVDAELLLACVLGIPRSRLALVDRLDQSASERFHTVLDRRAAREPLQHITGRAPFRRLDVAVGPGVFIPRPETELLVDAVPAAADRVVDLCAGSGALALAVADERPEVQVWAVERSPQALTWLRRNVAELPAGRRVHVVVGDVTDPDLLPWLHGGVAAVVSNPPYVPLPTVVDPEVRADPPEAVFAGADGLSLLPAVVDRAAQLLRPGGTLVMEHDGSHAEAVPALLACDRRFEEIADHEDLAGSPRYVTARRR